MSDTSLDVLTLGESMALLVANAPGPLDAVEQFTRRLAGAETNVAIGLARLGLRVGWISRVGADAFGAYVRGSVEKEGVDCSRVEVDPQRSTGFMLKERVLSGQDPKVEYYRRGSAASALSLANWDAAYALSARHLHATGISPALSRTSNALVEQAMRHMRSVGRTVSFDPNLRPSLWPSTGAMSARLNELASLADWVLPGLVEGQLLTGQQTPEGIADFYLERGAQCVVVKLGVHGAYLRTIQGEAMYVSGVRVSNVVDTVGAGDGFAVGVISARLEGATWQQAAQRGNWIGARAIQVVGDMDGLPHRHELPELS